MKTIPLVLLVLSTPVLAGVPSGVELGVDSTRTGLVLKWSIPLPSGVSTIEHCTDLRRGAWFPVRHFTGPNTGELGVEVPFSGPGSGFFRIAFHDVSAASARMALVPVGTFQMGDSYGESSFNNDVPVHAVHLSSFLIDRFEVSNEDMRSVLQWAYDRGLVDATSARVINAEGDSRELMDLELTDSGYPAAHISFAGGTFAITAGLENHPCTGLSWYGAQAYCNYLSDIEGRTRCISFADWTCDFSQDGYRLPTEAEWEKAARGGLTGHHFPWESLGGGSAEHIDRSKANFTNSPFFADPNHERTTPVGYFDGHQHYPGPDMGNGYGLYDMAGNAWEWCWDFYQEGWYAEDGAVVDDGRGPAGPLATRVIRGGGWGHNDPQRHRCSTRFRGFSPHSISPVIGFRCVRNL